MSMSDTDILRESSRRLAEDLKRVVDDAESILQQKVQDAGTGFVEARERLERSLQSARGRLETVNRSVLDSSREALHSTDEYVRDHPWQSVGVGVGVGLLVGLLIGRK